MPWVVADVVVVLLSVGALVLAGLALWRRVRALGHDVQAASSRVGDVTRALHDLSDARSRAVHTSPDGHLPSSQRRRGSVRGA